MLLLVPQSCPRITRSCCIFHADEEERTRGVVVDKLEAQHGSRKSNEECRILLLGSSDSGKSTIVKQMKIMYQGGFSRQELLTYRPTIYKNLLDSAQAIILAMRKFGFNCFLHENRSDVERIMAYSVQPTQSFTLSQEIAEAIHHLWQDPIMHEVMEHANEFHLMDSAAYFLSEVLRLSGPDYVPNAQDMLRAKVNSSGITETLFSMGRLPVRVFDVGGKRSERKGWIHVFEDVTSIIFCTALPEYDQVLEDVPDQNKMTESLILFESVINSRWFLRTSIILFLNKIDVFKQKLSNVPLNEHFPEYTGGADVNKAVKYILWKFMQANRAHLSVYPYLTQATDTTKVQLVFSGVQKVILQNMLKDTGIL